MGRGGVGIAIFGRWCCYNPIGIGLRIILDYIVIVYGRAGFLDNNTRYRAYGGVFGDVKKEDKIYCYNDYMRI